MLETRGALGGGGLVVIYSQLLRGDSISIIFPSFHKDFFTFLKKILKSWLKTVICPLDCYSRAAEALELRNKQFYGIHVFIFPSKFEIKILLQYRRVEGGGEISNYTYKLGGSGVTTSQTLDKKPQIQWL